MIARTVLEKMGLREGQRARLSNVPANLQELFGPAPASVRSANGDGGSATAADWHLIFVADSNAIREAAADFVAGYARGQSLWIAYPKKSSGVKTDISRDRGWDPITELGLLAVTQISIDGTWSALRFRYKDEIRTIRRKF